MKTIKVYILAIRYWIQGESWEIAFFAANHMIKGWKK